MTTIGPSLKINGELTSNEDVTIEGTITGKISLQSGSLVVGKAATVEADAQVSRVTIHGAFNGDLSASERVELTNSANVTGTVVAPAVVLQDGAVFNGMLEVSGRAKGNTAQFEQKKAS